MADAYDIHPKYGVPKEILRCPGCGRIYRGRVCRLCENCKPCCNCEFPEYLNAEAVKESLAKTEAFPKSPGGAE